jgi:hypothetical protein
VIVRDDGLGVPQTAHSALAGRLAEAWRIDDDLPAQDLRVAATIHDIGWADWEQDAPDDPPAFHALPAAEHAAIWTAGTDAAATFGRWVGLLVSLHCSRLMGWRQEAGRGGPEVAALLAREAERQAALRDGLAGDVVDRASSLLASWDGLSLGLCAGRAQAELDLPAEWPFTADVVALHVDARELSGARRWRTLTFELTAPPGA